MVRKTFLKTVVKTIKSKFIRFLINTLIVGATIALSAALGMLPFSLKDSYLVNFNDNTPDIIIKSKNETGFDNDVKDKIKNLNNVNEYFEFMTYDHLNDDKYERLYFMDLKNDHLGIPSLESGKMPTNYNEIVICQNADFTSNYKIGDKIILKDFKINYPISDKEFEIVGIVSDSLYSSTHPVRANTEDEKYFNDIFYIDINTVPEILRNYIPTTDIYISMKNKSQYMTDKYDTELNVFISSIEEKLNKDGIVILTLNENSSYAFFKNYNNKINIISIIFPILFIVVCGLVTYLIITRLLADERQMIACYYSIGGSKRSIRFKYLSFSLISSILGSSLGYFLGLLILPKLFYEPYRDIYIMHGILNQFYSPIGIIMSFVIILSTLLVTLLSINKALSSTPSSLMLLPTPKPGKKILLEKIPFIWNKLSFSLKSCIRNIFRNKKHLILTSLSVIGSVVLVLIGLGLFDAANDLKDDPTYKNLANNMWIVSLVIVAFGILISILIIYALASMNIDERVREIAVLKVLGYYDHESALYACRELIYITLVAALFGIPIATLLIYFIFKVIDFSSVSAINWYSYLFSYLIVVLTSIFSSLMLYPKIKKIDFNISLKSVE